ncbi:uncharacterized protein EDB93DRAFT_1159563 [Suillus bovinus]|uniref:uncharacterized protein n=1 Tax=Suillus bovinus TaxID=48563 RepID=UPI001B8603D9|nr:uncharacterized protein EDB93DRAFT_1159563 [Suillus bovinus]KAG2141388.1 hypothetical protein EDB93DRAFT_1159563 [Suillus bovinus]
MKLVQILYLTILTTFSVATNPTRVEVPPPQSSLNCPNVEPRNCIKTYPKCPAISPVPFETTEPECWVGFLCCSKPTCEVCLSIEAPCNCHKRSMPFP